MPSTDQISEKEDWLAQLTGKQGAGECGKVARIEVIVFQL